MILRNFAPPEVTAVQLVLPTIITIPLDIPSSGSKPELVARLMLFDRYDKLDEESLRAKCRKDGKRYEECNICYNCCELIS